MANLDVVITGYKLLSSAGWDKKLNLDILYSRKSLPISLIRRYNIEDVSLIYAAQILDRIENSWDKKLRKYASLKDVAALSTIKQVWDESEAQGVYEPLRSSLYTGMGSNQVGDLSGYFANVLHCLDDNFKFNSSKFGATLLDSVNPMIVMEAILNNTLCYGSKYLNFRGRNSNFMDWEASSFWAIKEGFNSIRESRSDVAIVGGTSASLDPFNVMEDYHDGYYQSGDNLEDIVSRVCPYSLSSEGSIPVEGSCYLQLEREDQAKKRGANIFARICGIRVFCGKTGSLKHAIRSVMKDTQTRAEDLCFIVGSGCGTRWDLVELEELGSCDFDLVPMFSARSSFYNMIEPSTALGVVSAVEAFLSGVLAPTRNYKSAGSIKTKLKILDEAVELDKSKSKALIPCISRNNIVGALIIERV